MEKFKGSESFTVKPKGCEGNALLLCRGNDTHKRRPLPRVEDEGLMSESDWSPPAGSCGHGLQAHASSAALLC